MPYICRMPPVTRQKTSVYLDTEQVRRLTDLAEYLGRSQAEIIRAAIDSYEPTGPGDRDFALARGFERVDPDPKPISETSEEDLLDGFGR